MGFWNELGRRISHLTRRGRFDLELEEEMRFHVEARIEELESGGMPHSDAVQCARREFGSNLRAAENTRDAWRYQWLEDFLADLRHAARSFSRSPAFALTAIGCLALGIAANTVIFSLVNAVLLRTLPYPDPGRLVMVRFTPANQPEQKLGSNSGTYFFIREHNRVFERMGALRLTNFSIAADPKDGDSVRQWVPGGWVTPGMTDTIGVNPIIGRWFEKTETAHAVISHGLWQRVYGGAPDVLGKQLLSDTGTVTIIGVMPAGYQTLNPDIAFWRLQPDENLANALRSPNRVFNPFARLKPGVTLEQAQADMANLAEPLAKEYEMNRGWNIKVEPLREAYVGHLRQPLLVFQGAVVILLLIACANVAGLLLAQASSRHKELALRSALGSTRVRVIRQLLTESLLLGVAGGALGIGLGWAGVRAFTTFAAALLPAGVDVNVDVTVVAFASILSIATGLLFGTVPALQISRPDLMEVLRESSRSTTAGKMRQHLRSAFVVVEVALALVLLIGAGLLTHSLLRLNMVGPGFNPHDLLTFQVPFSRSLYHNAGNTPTGGLQVEMTPKFNVMAEQVRDQISRVPGIAAATFAMTPPLGGVPRRLSFKKDGDVLDASQQDASSAEWYPVGPSYFQTMQIPVARGRDFNTQDSSTSPQVVVINEAMAKRYFPSENPIGRRIHTSLIFDPPREIVGVVGNIRQNRYEYASQPQMYIPYAQIPAKLDMTLSFDVLVATYIVRANASAAGLVPAARQVVSDVDRTQSVTNIQTVEQYAAGQLQDLRHYAALLSIFGGISILLSFIGLFGIMAHTVMQRTNEIGIRVALGATSASVLRLIARQGLVLVGIGMMLGLIVSVAVTRVIERFLWGVTPTDPLTFVLVLVLMAAVAMLACYVPARRALRIDPINALRWE